MSDDDVPAAEAAAALFDSDADDEGRTSAIALDSDSDDPMAADAFESSSDDDVLGVPVMHAIFGHQSPLVDAIDGDDSDVESHDIAQIPVIPGPFTAAYFANIPPSWMDPPSDEIEDSSDDEVSNHVVDNSMDIN